MPNRAWRARYVPPSILDHLATHVYEAGISLLGVIAGIGIVATAMVPWIIAAPSVEAMHAVVAIAVGVMMIMGGLLIFAGLIDNDDDLVRGWRMERTGLMIAATGWIGWGVSMALAQPNSPVGWALVTGTGALHFIRLAVTYATERNTRQAVEAAKGVEGVGNG